VLLTPIGIAGIVSVGGIVLPPAPIPPIMEDFEPYSPGGLGGQGLWSAQGPNSKPRIDVVGGSLMEGVNSLKVTANGTTLGFGWVEKLLPVAMVGHKLRMSLEVKIPTGAINDQLEVDVFAGPTDPVWTKWAAGFVFKATPSVAECAVYDRYNNPTTFVCGSLDVKMIFHFEFQLDGTYTIFDSGGSELWNGVLSAGNETITEYVFSTDGIVPTVTALFDNILWEVIP
jgi:hypothetical protein